MYDRNTVTVCVYALFWPTTRAFDSAHGHTDGKTHLSSLAHVRARQPDRQARSGMRPCGGVLRVHLCAYICYPRARPGLSSRLDASLRFTFKDALTPLGAAYSSVRRCAKVREGCSGPVGSASVYSTPAVTSDDLPTTTFAPYRRW